LYTLGYFEQARAADSTWMAPLQWILLATMDVRPAEADSLLDVIEGNLEHMSEPEVLRYQIIRSHMYEYDPTVRLRAVRRLATLAPVAGTRWGYLVSWQAYRPQEALEFLARVDTTGVRFARYEVEYWDVMTRSLHMLGDHEAELEAIREARHRLPDVVPLLDRHLAALGALGRSADLRSVLDTLLSLPHTWTYAAAGSSFVSHLPPHGRAANAAKALYTHDHPDAAEQVFEQGLQWLESQPRRGIWTSDPLYRRAMADLLYALDRVEEAGVVYQRLVEEAGDQPWVFVDVLPSLACVTARLGDLKRARAINAQLAERIQKIQRSRLDIEGKAESGILRGRARIAAVLGEREETIRLLREGFRVARHKGEFVREAHFTRDFESLRDYLPYQQFLKPRG
jgi:tetratricopeptide (TPR) repeat protein